MHTPRRTIYVSDVSGSIAAGLRTGFIATAPEHIAALEPALETAPAAVHDSEPA